MLRHQGDLASKVAVDLRDNLHLLTILKGGDRLDAIVDTSDNLGLNRANNVVNNLLRDRKFEGSNDLSLEVLNTMLVGPATCHDLVGNIDGTHGNTVGDGLLLGKTFSDLVLNATEVGSAGHPEESRISPAGSPAVGKEPVVLARVDTPSDKLNTVTTEVASAFSSVDSLRMKGEIGVEVVIDGEASLERTIVVQLSLDLIDISRKRLERSSIVGDRLSGPAVALAGVASRRSSGTRVVGSTSALAQVSAGSATSVDQVVPRSLGVSTTTSIPRALQDGLRGDNSGARGFPSNAHAVCERLNTAEVPAGAALLLIEDGVDAAGPLGAGIKIGGQRKSTDQEDGHNNSDLHFCKIV